MTTHFSFEDATVEPLEPRLEFLQDGCGCGCAYESLIVESTDVLGNVILRLFQAMTGCIDTWSCPLWT